MRGAHRGSPTGTPPPWRKTGIRSPNSAGPRRRGPHTSRRRRTAHLNWGSLGVIAVILLNIFIRIFGCRATTVTPPLRVSNDPSGDWVSPWGPQGRAALVHVARRHGPSAYDGSPRSGADETEITGLLQIQMTDEEDRQLFDDILSMEARSPEEVVVNDILQRMARLIFRNASFIPTRLLAGNKCGQFADWLQEYLILMMDSSAE